MPAPKTPLVGLEPAHIPRALRAHNRWAPWVASWNERRGKFDKIPYRADAPTIGLSTARPDIWYSLQGALDALTRSPGRFAGVGFCMTGVSDLVGVDLDNCIDDQGVISPVAREIVDGLASYTEISPSGRGLRVFVEGHIEYDWTAHEAGIEVYAGNDARFLTITGRRLPNSVEEIMPLDHDRGLYIEELTKRYAVERSRATVIDLNAPDLLDEIALPDLPETLPPSTLEFLATGDTGRHADRSQALWSAAVSLANEFRDDQTVYSILAHNPHAMSVALDHRRQDSERALAYLWRHHVVLGRARAVSRVSPDDFDELASTPPPSTVPAGALATGPTASTSAAKGFVQAALYLQRPAASWLVKGWLPDRGLAAVAGESGAGKTFLVLDLVMSVARGEPWLGSRVRQGAVAYVAAEGAGGLGKRLQAYASYWGVDLAALPLHVTADAPNIMLTDSVRELGKGLKALGPLRVVVLDTLAQVTPGADENSGADMGKALAHCRAIYSALGCLVILVAHHGKDKDKGIRGWSGIRAALDAEIIVERSGPLRGVTLTKSKDGGLEGTEHGFELNVVKLGTDDDGDEITSCVVRPTITPQRSTSVRLGKLQQQVMGVLEAAQALLDDDDPGVPLETLVREVVARIPRGNDLRDRRGQNVRRAVNELIDGGLIGCDNDVVVALRNPPQGDSR